MRRTFALLVLLFMATVLGPTVTGATPAQSAAEAPPTEYHAVLTAAYAADEPGAAVLVAKHDRILFRGAVGMADLELGVPLGPDMVFEIGSLTKQFTAAAIMLLVEEGKLSVADPITRHLPDYPSYGDAITIEHLLTHTSGIVSYTAIPGYMATRVRNDVTVRQLIDVFKDLPVEFAPGERYAYSNSGYVLLGAIIEAAGGLSYADFVRTRFFEPLGMEHAYYGCTECVIPRRSPGYGGAEGGYANQSYLSFTQPFAAGALMMTVEDLFRWSRALFRGDVVSAKSLERMSAPFVLKNGRSTGYGYGLSIGDVKGHRAIWHGGGIFGFSTFAAYLPDEDVFVAAFSNTSAGAVGPRLVTTKLAALAVGDPFPTFTEIALDTGAVRPYVGVYRIDQNAEHRVTIRDGALYTQRTGGPWVRAHPASATHFFSKTSLSHFEFVGRRGQATIMRMYEDGGDRPEDAVKVADTVPTREAIALDPAILSRYVGVYELRPGFDLSIYVEGGRLMGQATGQRSIRIHPTSETEFFVEEVDARITFILEPGAPASALILHQHGRDIRGRRKN